MNLNYPNQIGAIKRKDKILGVDAQLFTPQESEKVSPLEIHSGFSRFVLTIVDKTGGTTTTPKANIPCADISKIKHRTDMAVLLLMQKESGGVVESTSGIGSSPAFTVPLMDKMHKGKTPAEVLIENPGEAENLKKTRAWLSDPINLQKYPKNKEQLNAIDDALNLLEIGELGSGIPAPAPTSKPITIYKKEFKQFSQKNERGDSLIYSISIVFDASRDYPFTIELSNCFAPVDVLPTGQRQPVMSKATNQIKSSLAMTEDEWVELVDQMQRVKTYFELTNFRPLFEIARKASEEARKK